MLRSKGYTAFISKAYPQQRVAVMPVVCVRGCSVKPAPRERSDSGEDLKRNTRPHAVCKRRMGHAQVLIILLHQVSDLVSVGYHRVLWFSYFRHYDFYQIQNR